MRFLNVISLFTCALLLSPTAGANEQQKLENWLSQVVQQHPRLQATQAAADKATAELRAADQPLFNPELELEYEQAGVDTKTAGITQSIDWGDKRFAQTRVADYKLQLSLTELTVAQQKLTAEILLALATYQASIDTLKVIEKRSDSMSQFFSIAKQRYQAGDLAEIELALAQLASSEASFELAGARSELIINKQNLYMVLGNGGNAPITSLPIMSDVPNNSEYPIKDSNQLLDRLPEMRLARARMNIARAEIKLRQREQRPNPSIGIKTGKEGSDNLTSLSFSMPLFVRNNLSAEVEAAQLLLIQREYEATSTRQALLAQLASAEQTLQVNRQAWVQWKATGGQHLLRKEKLLGRLWKAGELSTADYLVQLKQSLDTEESVIRQRAKLWQSWTKWLIASGDIARWTRSKSNLLTNNSPKKLGSGE
ncbi:MAG: TolC family protein [Cycloclasticus sp.]